MSVQTIVPGYSLSVDSTNVNQPIVGLTITGDKALYDIPYLGTAYTTYTAAGSLATASGFNYNPGTFQLTAPGLIQGGSFQNTSNTASITNLGAITGTSLALGSGNITTTGTIGGGAITGTSLNAGSGTITTTGTVQGATIRNTANNGSIAASGAITGTSVNAGSGIIYTSGTIIAGDITGASLDTTGAITGGAITGTSLALGSGNITTTGTIGAGDITGTTLTASDLVQGGSFQNTSNSASITNLGAITGTSLALGSGNITTTGTIGAGDITGTSLTASGLVQVGSFQNTSNSASITNLGAITGTSLTASGLVQVGSFQNTSNTASITNLGAITGTSLSLGSGNITTTGSVGAGDITGAALTGTSLALGSGNFTTLGTIGAGGITGTSVNAGSGNITTTGTVRGDILRNSANSGSISASGLITGTTLTDGTASLNAGSWTSAVNFTGSGAIQGGSFRNTSNTFTVSAAAAIAGSNLTLTGTSDTTINLTGTGGGLTVAAGTVTAARGLNDSGGSGTGTLGYILQARGGTSGYKWVVPPTTLYVNAITAFPTLTTSEQTVLWSTTPTVSLSYGTLTVTGNLIFQNSVAITSTNNSFQVRVFGGSTGATQISQTQVVSLPINATNSQFFVIPFLASSTATGSHILTVKILGNSSSSVGAIVGTSQMIVTYNT